ncbi:MAG: Ig-like domain-containing protein [Verrucomicrobiia bacterium]
MKRYIRVVKLIVFSILTLAGVLVFLKNQRSDSFHRLTEENAAITGQSNLQLTPIGLTNQLYSLSTNLKREEKESQISSISSNILFVHPNFPQKLREDEIEFKRFNDWVEEYAKADARSKAELEQKGVVLAQERLRALGRMIVNNPQRALELALQQGIKQSLPDSVRAFTEQQVNARAKYEVVCVFPLDNDEHNRLSLIRSARVGEETYRIFTYGKGLEYVTKQSLSINGIAVPIEYAPKLDDKIGLNPTKFMAMSPAPARLLDKAEATARGVSTPVAVELGGEVFTFSTMTEAALWASDTMQSESPETPDLPPNLPTAESSYTEGRKRFLLMRVDFPDYQVEALTTNAALTLMNDFSNFMAQASYSKFVVAPVGQGSDITPVMRMSENASAYDNAGLSKLYPEARNTARDVYGYDLNKYDFFFVVTGSKPAYGYAGLGYVGGVGFHLANSYFDVRTTAHEFGHNLGFGHANWWNTGDKSMIGSGQSDEYGDPFDTMGGSGGGRRHYSSWFKNKAGWISNSDCPTATTSGVYRLYAQDIIEAPVGVRGIRINRPTGDPYWLEFRQLWTDNTAMMNGVSLRWVSGSTILIDTTPGSSGGKDDHSLTIGRTFADSAMNLYITPLRKAHTYPESVDIAIYFGPFPTNKPPEVILAASTTTAAVNQAVVFMANATDPNGDTLAYFWDFGDGTYSTESVSNVSKTFSSAGLYRVTCTVSDLKGGIAANTIVVMVGTPRTYSISGRVLTLDGAPLVGIKVYIDSGKYCFSGSDGSYTISGLSLGSYTLNAMEPVYGSNTFIAPPSITLGPDYYGADFFLVNSSNIYTTIVSKKSVWKYLDNGSDQGTNWISLNFDDSGWSNGAAILGYGEGNETTVINYGPDSNNKYITYYFRQKFNITSQTLAGFTNLLLEVLRDDGVIVYINGVEVFRDNMPTNNPITYRTTALTAIEPDSYLQATLPTSVLRAGTNIIAAEVHQASGTSSDVNFDLALSGVSSSELSAIRVVYIDSPKDGQVFYNPGSITISAQAKTGSGAVNGVVFFADSTQLGQDFSSPYEYVWNSPPEGIHTLKAVMAAGGKFYTSAPVRIQISAPLYQPPPIQIDLVDAGSVWYYFATNTSAPTNWFDLYFDHTRWASGRAELGYGENDEATKIPYGQDSNNKWITAYFRKFFTVNDPSAITNLVLNLKRDDGAIVYLNGKEVVRDLLPPGEITWSTLATNAPDDGQNFNPFTIDPKLLLNGTNSLAVEIHQSALNSSDLSFDLSLVAYAATNRNRGIWITTPTNNSQYSSVAIVRIATEVVVGGNLSVSKVQFYIDNSLYNELTSRLSEYFIDWAKPLPGVHQIYAVATDSAGLSITSAPVQIFVKSPPVTTELISFGDVWRYLDNGTDQGAAWRYLNYDDRKWKSASAKFGYGNDGEITTVYWGTNSSTRFITTYFRKTFFVSNPSAFSGLLLNVIRDDGVVVYLNGNEVFRDNMLDGFVSFNSLAVKALGAPEETAPVQTVISPNLIAGTNIIAVEVHQASASSSDLGFDLELLGIAETNMATGIYITSPYNGARLLPANPVDIQSFAVAGTSYVQKVDYYINNVKAGESLYPPYQIQWTPDRIGTYTLKAVAYFGNGQSIVSPLVTVAVNQPPGIVEPVITTVVPAGSEWLYWDNSQAVAAGWQTLGFNDASWQTGVARFGFGFDGEKTLLTEGRVTYYFRRYFYITNVAMFTELEFRLQRDDGAVVYLNGKELYRENMPSGAITASTVASTTVNTPDETVWFITRIPIEQSGIVNGTNVIAVEIHQAAANSSDLGFDFELVAYGDTAPRVIIVSPVSGSSYSITSAVPIQVSAWAGYQDRIQGTEFYVNGIKLGEISGETPTFNWTTLLPGNHTISARSYTASGRYYDAASVNIVVAQQSVSLLLVSSNSNWKYLDDGSNQGIAWRSPGFNDSLWGSGRARLGYGDDGEVTKLNYGTNANSKYITYYFRKQFTVPDGVVITNLSFYLLVDDGAVVYLDGTEAFRFNMPTGNIDYGTLASVTVSGAAEQTYYLTKASSLLTPGIHYLAVEVHQVNATSSDLAFDLSLYGDGYVQTMPPTQTEIRRIGQNIELSVPALYGDWRVFGYTNINHLISGQQGMVVPFSLMETNGKKYFIITPTEPIQFFRLGKP